MLPMTQSRWAQKPPPKPDQRRQDRVAVQIPGILRLPETRGGTYLITIIDVSKKGLRVCCPQALASEARVEVKFNGSTVFGVAKYARTNGNGFHVGIEADKVETAASRPEGAELDLLELFPVARTKMTH